METYNLKKMQELLKDFHSLTNMKICIYDSDENELCFYPEKFSSFCSLLRSNVEMNERCKNCDKQAFSVCKKNREQYIYTCHAGLLECISPIIYDDKIIGYIAIGQIKSPILSNFDDIENKLPSENKKTLKEKYENLPTIEIEKIKSAIRILDACTGYQYLKNLIKSSQNKIDIMLEEYINKHLEDELSVKIICDHFHFSHSEIYSIFKNYFNCSPAEYVKIRRLDFACELLQTTNLPVNEIAKKCGIADYNYFSKVFKKTFDISPREYRKKQKM